MNKSGDSIDNIDKQIKKLESPKESLELKKQVIKGSTTKIFNLDIDSHDVDTKIFTIPKMVDVSERKNTLNKNKKVKDNMIVYILSYCFVIVLLLLLLLFIIL